MTMGTASTMAAIVEVLGLEHCPVRVLDAGGVDSRGTARLAVLPTGRRAVEMVWEDLTPSRDAERRLRSTTR
jgi:dihydroxyacid dehydratase/phosphogluconate dehydratase